MRHRITSLINFIKDARHRDEEDLLQSLTLERVNVGETSEGRLQNRDRKDGKTWGLYVCALEKFSMRKKRRILSFVQHLLSICSAPGTASGTAPRPMGESSSGAQKVERFL